MRNLIQFLWKYRVFILFLLLEVFAFTLIIQNNSYQRSAFINSSNGFTSGIHAWVDDIDSYFHLKLENEKLAEENAALRRQLKESYIITDNRLFEIGDSTFRQEYTYTPAKVIYNSYQKRNNYININKGRKQGIEPNMGVIDSRGVIGVVKDVSNNFASVYSVLNSKTTVNAKLGNEGNTGIARWDGKDYKFGQLDFIPSHVEIAKGDTIFTSGNSAIFPEGVAIGSIDKFELKPGESFYTIRFKYFTDYNKLQNVYVVTNLLKEELEELKEGMTDDE